MIRSRLPAVLAALLCAAAIAGCGFGPGESEQGEATLTVTRDYGAERIVAASSEDPSESETVIRFLDREAEITTRYGGNFVQSIDGVANEQIDGVRHDWFFYVNGYWSPIGGGEARVGAGDRIWWDHHGWPAAYRIPAVVGSFPEPFLNGRDGEPPELAVECAGAEPACETVAERLRSAGADPEISSAAGAARRTAERGEALRVLVGPWDRLRADRTARLIERGPASSGVFATLERGGDGWRLSALDSAGQPVESFDSAGLIAATQRGDREPTWVVTGTDGAAVADAAAAFGPEELADRFALALAGGESLPLPAVGEGG